MRSIRVLAFHTYYQHAGGEDVVFDAEVALLRQKGHKVCVYSLSNRALEAMARGKAAVNAIWNLKAYWDLRRKIETCRPNVVHFHNTFPLASPGVIHAAKHQVVPTIVTLHNYRLLCLNALLYRSGQVCEDCVGNLVPWPGVVRGCYRDSRAVSGVVAAQLVVHRLIGTWGRLVDAYVSLTEFARQKFVEGGLPADKIVVKPNFVHPDPGFGDGRGGFALFVGRLSAEKGVDTLLAAWKRLQGRVPLKIVGDGPLASEVAATAERIEGVEWLGRKPRAGVLDLMKQASFLIFPSRWYEGFPMTIAEAFATGLPVVASNLGAMATLIDHERTGLHFRPGDPEDLVAKIEWLLGHPEVLARMRKEARAEYEAKYTAERNYQMLMEIYARAIENAKKS